MNSRTPEREREFAACGWGQTTPRESLNLLVDIRQRRAVSPAADAYVDRTLASTLFFQDSMFALPTDVHVIVKTGAVNASRSEVMLMSSPQGAIGCSMMTDQLADTSWELDGPGFTFLREIARITWDEWGSGSLATLQEQWPPTAATGAAGRGEV